MNSKAKSDDTTAFVTDDAKTETAALPASQAGLVKNEVSAEVQAIRDSVHQQMKVRTRFDESKFRRKEKA